MCLSILPHWEPTVMTYSYVLKSCTELRTKKKKANFGNVFPLNKIKMHPITQHSQQILCFIWKGPGLCPSLPI